MNVETSPGRIYAGKAPGERRADRRARLVDAGLQVFGTVAWDEAGITLICATARVGTRAFYEEFDSREDLLLEVATGIVEQGALVLRAVLEPPPETLAAAIVVGLTGFLGFVSSDPRRARVLYGAVPCAEQLTPHRHLAARGLTGLFREQRLALGIAPPAPDNHLLALAITGAISELMGFWVTQSPPPALAPTIDELSALLLAALR